MKTFSLITSFLLSAALTSAQLTRLIAPSAGQHLVAGQDFEVSVALGRAYPLFPPRNYIYLH